MILLEWYIIYVIMFWMWQFGVIFIILQNSIILKNRTIYKYCCLTTCPLEGGHSCLFFNTTEGAKTAKAEQCLIKNPFNNFSYTLQYMHHLYNQTY